MPKSNDWSFEANLERGHLPTGESLEALYGAGPWTKQPMPEPQVTQCPKCNGQAYELSWDEIDCENCGKINIEA